MFRRLVAIGSVLVLLVVIGCTSATNSGPGSPALGSGNEPPADATWISPAKVMVSNFHPGGRAEYNLTIHNGSTDTAKFSVQYRYPDHVGVGYDMPPAVVQDWVIIVDSTIVLQGRETRDVLIVLDMPLDATISSSKWEFWVGVVELNQAGLVRVEMATRWLVSMR